MADQGQHAGTATRRKHDTILDAAVEMFLALGFDQTSMDAVAARANVSKTTVYAHFGDKLELFRAVIARGAAALDFDLDQQTLTATDEPEERLTRILVKLLQATTEPNYLAFIRVIATETVRRPELTETIRSLGVPHVIDLVAATLREDALRHGYELPHPNAYAALYVRMAAAGPQMDALLDLDFNREPEYFQAHARWTTSLFLRALRAQEAGPLPATPGTGLGETFPWT